MRAAAMFLSSGTIAHPKVASAESSEMMLASRMLTPVTNSVPVANWISSGMVMMSAAAAKVSDAASPVLSE